MSDALDDIWMDTDCPKCGATVRFTYGQAKLAKAAGCKCGLLFRLDISDTGIEAVDALINEAERPARDND